MRGGDTAEQRQSGNLQYRDPKVVENVQSSGLQYNMSSNFQGANPQYVEDMRSGGLQFHDLNAIYHDEKKKPPSSVPVIVKVDPPAELPEAPERDDHIASKRIFGLKRRTFWILAAILLLLVIGGVVGGAVAGTQNRQSSREATVAAPTVPAGSATVVTSTGPSGLTTTLTVPAIPTSFPSASAAAPTTLTVISTASASAPATSPAATQPAAPVPTISPQSWYRLTNLYLGPGISLDVINDAGTNSSGKLQMASTGRFSGQYWQILSASSSTFSLRTMFLGPTMCLSVVAGAAPNTNNVYYPQLAPKDGSSAQTWKIETLSDGTFRLSSEAQEGLYMDTYADTHELFLGTADHSGQHWKIDAIEAITDPAFLEGQA